MMYRRIAFALVVVALAGCSGYGGAFVPRDVSNAVTRNVSAQHRNVRVDVRIRIPRRRRGKRIPFHPATISPLTQSVSIGVNGGTPTVFNATPASPNCSATSGGTLCAFAVDAKPGSDTFVVTTYSGVSAGGAMLDRGTAVVKVVPGKANSFQITLGPVVSTTADSGIGSLRYAVANANSGDTITFVLPAGSTIALASLITPPVSLSIAGPGVTASLRHRVNRHGIHSNATYSGVTISGGGAQQLFLIKAGVSVTISGLVLSDGAATVSLNPGGAIENSGTLSLASDAITDSISNVDTLVRRPVRLFAHKRLRPHCVGTPYVGGAILNAGALTVTDSIFDGNVVSDNCPPLVHSAGGAIYNSGALTVTGSTFTNNFGDLGGAVANYASIPPTFDHDVFTGNGGCEPFNGCAIPTGLGGAIFDDGLTGAVITNSTFSGNVDGGNYSGSNGQGGALYLAGGSYTIAGDAFTGNVAGGGSENCSNGNGGAIYDVDSGSNGLELDNDTFSNNTAGGDLAGIGGAVGVLGTLRGSNDVFTGNTALGTGTSSCTHDAYAYGGAIDARALVLSSSTFTGNTATANDTVAGGAILAIDTSSLTNDTFSSNGAIATGLNSAGGPTAQGGSVDIAGTGQNLTLDGDTFTSNSVSIGSAAAISAMGGAAATHDGYLTSSNDSFNANAASANGGTGSTAAGGAVAAGGSFSSSNDTFHNNTATSTALAGGGAAFVATTFSVYNDAFSGNATSTSLSNSLTWGGALLVQGAGTIASSTFTANSVASTSGVAWGGALFDSGGTTLNGVTVNGNTATDAGGGIFADEPEAINRSTIDGNSVTAGKYALVGGGGVYGNFGLTISNTTIAGNTVATTFNDSGGGGIFDGDGLTMTGSTISGNSVVASGTGDGGGGIFNEATATLIDDTIADNASNLDGGGIYTYDPSNVNVVNLMNVTLYQNKATGNGGNIYNPTVMMTTHPYEVVLYSSIIAGGSAASGPDVYNVSGAMASADYNVIGSAAPYGFTPASHDKTATNPLLLPLANNGGPTFTNADQSTSPGRGIPYVGGDCGNAAAVMVDQRGYSRGAGGVCDAGAYEFSGVATAVKLRPPKVRASARRSGAHSLHVPRLHVPVVQPLSDLRP